MEHFSLNSIFSRDAIRQAEQAIDEGSIIFSISYLDDAIYLFKSAKANMIFSYDIKNIMGKLSAAPSEVSTEELACLIHHLKYHKEERPQFNKKKNKPASVIAPQGKPQPEATSKASLIPQEGTRTPKASIQIFSKNNFPNASSIWEKWNISIKIIYNTKEYVGNTNKLRQIRFDSDSISSDISLRDFDSQTRQIIRFITQNAEPDGNGFSLKADLAAELFHSLISFDNFYYNEQKIIVHSEKAYISALPDKNDPSNFKACLKINRRMLSLANPFVILGKAGMWVGENGEYWWIDGIYDLVWLRAFILSDKNTLDSIKNHITLENEAKKTETPTETFKCQVRYIIDYSTSDPRGLLVRIAFKYGNAVFNESDARIELASNTYIKRDKDFELFILNSMLSYGFSKIQDRDGASLFVLSDLEGIGLFAQYNVLEIFSLNNSELFLTPTASKLLYSEIKTVSLSLTSPVIKNDYAKAKFKLSGGTCNFKWKEALMSVRENRTFLYKEGRLFKIEHELGLFIRKSDEIITISGGDFSIPVNSIPYLADISKNIQGIIPDEWLELAKNIRSNKPSLKEDVSLKDFKGTLRDYQYNAVAWMRKMLFSNCNVILADEMGLGKTIQSLALILSLFEENPALKPVLVVCPTSLIYNWEAEAKKFTPSLKTLIIGGSGRKELIRELSSYNLLITSYAIIRRDIELYNDINFSLLILDEAQHIKNSDTLNSRVCKQINANHKLVLTGTPLENSPEDIWSIFDFLSSGTLGSKETFKNHYYGIQDDKDMQSELAQRIKPFILRRKKVEVEQLPEKTEQILYCEMSKNQRRIYNEILYKGRIECDSFLQGKSTRFNVLSSLLRLRQLCCHPGLLPDTEAKKVTESAKTELLNELILEIIDSGHRTLVFSQFTSLLYIIKKWCSSQNIPFEYLDGNTKDRISRVNNFNKSKDIPLFLLSLKAGGVGLNLTGADTVIIYDPWWNPSVEAQATDRTHRIGQKKPITTIKLVVKDSIEEKILDLQNRKRNLFSGIIDSSSSFSKLTDKDIQFLLN